MTFGELIHELECDYGRINFRERLMLRRAYDVVLEEANTELKKEYSDNLSLKDEELMCLETEFNTYKSEAKELLDEFLDFESSCMERGIKISDKIRAEAEQFLKETE